MAKKTKNSNKRHKFLFALLKPIIRVFSRVKLGFRYKKVERKDLPERYILLSNHVTDYDPILLGAALPDHAYFVASEHIARFKPYKLLKWTFDPIIRYKGTVASATVMDVLRRIRKGSNVCVLAEGVRTFDGVTCPVLPSTAKLVKAAKCGLVTYKLTGGYFVSPLWASTANTRKGDFYGEPVNVYTKEQIAGLTETEIQEIIERDLFEDAYARQLAAPKKYKGKSLSDGLETFLFVCPECEARASFVSEKQNVCCEKCGLKISYDEYGTLHGSPYKTVRDFSLWQDERVCEDVRNNVPYQADCAALYSIQPDHAALLLTKGELILSPEKLVCGDFETPLENVYDVGTCGRYKLAFAVEKTHYELILEPKGNVVRFQKYFRTCKNAAADAANA